MPAWTAEFGFYEAAMGGDRAFVTLDLAARAHAPVATHPVRLQSMLNGRLQRQMEKSGDHLEIPREVDHLVVFSSEPNATSAAVALAKAGFRIDPLRGPEGDDGTWRLEFHRTDACDGERPDRFVFEVLDLIEPFDGEFDGWGSVAQ